MARKATDFPYGIRFPGFSATLIEPSSDHTGSLYLVPRVRDLAVCFRSQLILYLSDSFDCGNWLLFEVCMQCELCATH